MEKNQCLSCLKSAVALLLVSTFTICFSNAQGVPDYIILSGKIKNIPPGPDGKKVVELVLPFVLSQPSKEIPLAEDGSFNDTIWKGTGEYAIWDRQNLVPLYLRGSRKYSIEYDMEHFRDGDVKLGGSDTATNRYFVGKGKRRKPFAPDGDGKNESEFRLFIGDLKTGAMDRLEKANLAKQIVLTETKSIQYEYLFNLYLFLALKELGDPLFKPSKASENELKLNYQHERDYKSYYNYQKLVFEYQMKRIRGLAKELQKKDSSYSLRQNRMELLASAVHNEYIRNHLITEIAMSDIKEAKDIERFYSDFKKYYTGNDEDFRNSIANAYLRLSKLKKGTPSPEFVDYINYNGGKSSLKDFRGRYVYIDLWATWCGNCWEEMPYLKELERRYQSKNIVFISISLDENKAGWTKTVKEKMMSGVQLLAGPQEVFLREYAVHGIPRYIFLDPQGAIVAYSAPRPSEEKELESLFRSVGL